jgi:GNAT superfamily N-acetyltransferase
LALIFRDAGKDDVPALVAMLADDPLGQRREGADMSPYLAAFDDIAANPMHQLIVGEMDGRIVATCQLTILAGLSRMGAKRALVEAVRVAGDLRSQGIGEALMAQCEARARAAGAGVLQLTTDKSRLRAHAFYDRLGFSASHIGYKKTLV